MGTAQSIGVRHQPCLQSMAHGGSGDRKGREVLMKPVCR